MSDLLITAAFIFGLGFAFGYCDTKPSKGKQPFVFHTIFEEATPPAAYFTVGDLQALMSDEGPHAKALIRGYWVGIQDALAVLASAERVGNGGACCAYYGPLAYLAVEEFLASGLGPTVDKLGKAVLTTKGGRDMAAAEVIFRNGAESLKAFKATWPVLLETVRPVHKTRMRDTGSMLPTFRTTGRQQINWLKSFNSAPNATTAAATLPPCAEVK